MLLVLALSANTAFADFPRLTRAIALDDYMPHVFLLRGRRLLYSWGIYVLVALTALLLIVFGGVTDRLIPLYAIGAFMAFTLSQAGMVMHWKRKGKSTLRMCVNGLGALATGITALVVLVAKFVEGAWITALLIIVLILLMRSVKRHYMRVDKETFLDLPFIPSEVSEPVVVLPMDRWSRITEKALAFALSMSADVRCLHVQIADEPDTICKVWEDDVAAPLRAAGKGIPKLVVSEIALPLRSGASRRLHPQGGTGNRKPQYLRAGAGAGGAPLVGEPDAQPPRRSAQSAPAHARQPPHRGDQYSLVSGTGLRIFTAIFFVPKRVMAQLSYSP